jgi:hypothetical protein
MASVKYETDAIQPDRRGTVVLRDSEPDSSIDQRNTSNQAAAKKISKFTFWIHVLVNAPQRNPLFPS